MKLTILMVLIFVLMGGTAIAQPAKEGYIVLNNGDTLYGRIKKPNASYLLHHQVIFTPKEEKSSYTFAPNELLAFQVGEKQFESRYIWSDDVLTKKFLKPLVKGYCTLYEYGVAEKSSRGMVGSPVKEYFVERKKALLHPLDFRKLKKGEDTYFDDNPALAKDIREGKYSKDMLIQIVERYNREAELRTKR